ncbi:expressed unknown protein [Seminavis robusta]|uniref:Uncharacterized protein n=1 Tax=Seminavis robusta TaxID=568900 RepID=A0A9N8ERS7_9STRA|nr:expressed unknown protein [Seminavis robusta]|eukprot:Sro1600_g285080.1 n/a (611) ;mRNA; f:18422-20254
MKSLPLLSLVLVCAPEASGFQPLSFFLSSTQDAVTKTSGNSPPTRLESKTLDMERTSVMTPRPPKSVPPVPQELFMKELSLDDYDEPATDSSTTGSTATKSMKEQHDQLVEDMWATEQVLQVLRANVTELEGVLETKQAQVDTNDGLQDLRRMVEQSQAEWEALQSETKERERSENDILSEYQDKQTELEEQVSVLQEQLVETQMKIRSEQDTYLQLTQRIAEVDGTQDWESTEFQQEQEKMQSDFLDKKAQLEQIQAEFDAQETELTQANAQIRAQLETLQEQAEQDESQLAALQENHKAQRNELQAAIQQQETMVAQAQDNIVKAQNDTQQDLQQLKLELAQVESQQEELQETLRTTSLDHLIQESKWQGMLARTNKAVQKLNSTLVRDTSRHSWEREYLLDRLQAETKQWQLVHDQLQKERLQHDKERQSSWQPQWDQTAQRQQTAASFMKNRYAQLRSTFRQRWRTAKQEGRRMEESLTEQYERNLQDMNTTLALLQETVTLAGQSRRTLQLAAEQETLDAKQLWEHHSTMGNRMTNNLQQAQLEAEYLEQDQKELSRVLQQTEEDIVQMESSLRQILRATWRLTRQRVRNRRRRIVDRILRRQKE